MDVTSVLLVVAALCFLGYLIVAFICAKRYGHEGLLPGGKKTAMPRIYQVLFVVLLLAGALAVFSCVLWGGLLDYRSGYQVAGAGQVGTNLLLAIGIAVFTAMIVGAIPWLAYEIPQEIRHNAQKAGSPQRTGLVVAVVALGVLALIVYLVVMGPTLF